MRCLKTLYKKQIVKDFFIFLIFMVFAGSLSLWLGMDRFLDTLNYHVYNPWAFLNNRLNIDLLPASKESYFNPFMDIPYYLGVRYFNNHPIIITFLLGFSYALFLFMIFKIASLIFKNYHRNLLTIISVFVAGSIESVIDNVGGFHHDIFIVDLVLIMCYLLLNSFGGYRPKRLFYIGLVGGITVGLKLTAIMYIIPFTLLFILFYKQFKSPFKLFLFYTLGGIIGFLITEGFWMYLVYQRFENPVFPYFNSFFNSPFSIENNTYTISMRRHIPDSFF